MKGTLYPTQKAAKLALQALLDSNDKAVYRAILLIYARQTAGEKTTMSTLEDNGIGFSGCDAELLSSYATQIQTRGWLTTNQLPHARRKIRKYWRQLWQLAEQKAASRAPAQLELAA